MSIQQTTMSMTLMDTLPDFQAQTTLITIAMIIWQLNPSIPRADKISRTWVPKWVMRNFVHQIAVSEDRETAKAPRERNAHATEWRQPKDGNKQYYVRLYSRKINIVQYRGVRRFRSNRSWYCPNHLRLFRHEEWIRWVVGSGWTEPNRYDDIIRIDPQVEFIFVWDVE